MKHIDDILNLFMLRGTVCSAGRGVSHLQHAWQCARLAAQAHATPELQLACWLHDLGHLQAAMIGTPVIRDTDDRHEILASQVLHPLFGPEVAEPVALHVAAKRYLVATQPRYADILSPASRRSLRLQGGPMNAEEAGRFMAHPSAGDALRLRAWDECAKLTEWQPASMESALAELTELMDEVLAQVA